MDLTKLFEVQRKLDAEIEKKHPTEKWDRVDKKFLALFTEIGELANEWRGFKFWSNDQELRTSVQIPNSEKDPLNIGLTVGWKIKNPLLEEYVDGIHFLLSLGLEFRFEKIDFRIKLNEYEDAIERTITRQFNSVFYRATQFEADHQEEDFVQLVLTYLGLGEMLGFSDQDIESAYMSKNDENHRRQDSGY